MSKHPAARSHPASERNGMHPKSTATQALVLDRLPSGELAWLHREPQPVASADDPDPHYVLTQKRRDWLARERAIEALFGCGSCSTS